MLRKTSSYLVVFALGFLLAIAAQQFDRFNAAHAQDGVDELAKLDERYFALFETDTRLFRAQFYTDKQHQRLIQAPAQGFKMPTADPTYLWYFDQRKRWVGEAENEKKKEKQPAAPPAA